VIGFSAGLGEELAFRGVLQPRLGLWLSNLFFTSVHAFQYNWDALIVIFVVGAVCGIVRQRINTTTCAIVHGVYNFLLIMLVVLQDS
ncbi:MAG: CPBP family intramembrane glutamic endopeptidase, partial [Cyanobacteria bacterium P01_E01_bin.34]